jgi:hypothetical protein
MIQVEDREVIRRAYFAEHKSIRAIAKELGHGRDTVAAALVAEPAIHLARAACLTEAGRIQGAD